MERWKNVKGFEGLYYVSSYGCVKRSDGKVLKQRKDKDGYLIVTLFKEKRRFDFRVHRLVGIAFIDNPNNFPIINHKDENPANNNIENLEWCTVKYNNNYGSRNKKISEKQRGVPHPYMQGCRNYFYGKHFCGGLHPQAKKIVQQDMTGNVIATYGSTVEAAAKIGCSSAAISKCCRGYLKTIKGFKWQYA